MHISSHNNSISRREREKLKRRDDILEVARQIFARDGFQKANLEEIAAHCELAKGTIYYYFESKEKLFLTVLEAFLDELIQQTSLVMRYKDTRSRIEALIRTMMELLIKRKALINVLFKEWCGIELNQDTPEKTAVWNKVKTFKRQIEDIFRDGIEEGEIINYDTSILAHLLIGMTHHHVWHSNSDPVEGSKFLTNILFDGLKKRENKV